MRRNNSIEDDSMSASQESLFSYEEQGDSSSAISTTTTAEGSLEKIAPDFGLGKGKPLSSAKLIPKKRIVGMPIGRPKGAGNYQKKQRVTEFGRKRGPKAKIRGVFGVPGLGLQRPTSDANNKTDEEPGGENRLVLCSAKDKFVLTQDICVMCGAIGTDQEGCLISCLQCGQCYHPYCVQVKVTKVILQRGWRCLDCTICEGCGQRHDEPRLILCDDCDTSYHTYCTDPPLDNVPHGTWKCKWCAVCQKCGSNSPGTNCSWQNSFTECGPCASQSRCASCSLDYADDELIIQCTYCDRWLHCSCDEIYGEEEAERCIDEGYKCSLCRPKDAPPPHLQPARKALPSSSSPTSAAALTPPHQLSVSNGRDDANESSQSLGLEGTHHLDGIILSGNGFTQIKSLQMELTRKKRKTKQSVNEVTQVKDQEAGIMAAIESVVAGSSHDNSLEDIKVEPMDPREEAEIYKDGMVWDRTESSPPEGFTLCTNEQGVTVLRKKRQRNLQKLGIGGFVVRNRAVRKDGAAREGDGDDVTDSLGLQFGAESYTDKKRKPVRKKTKGKLADTYPSYLQEAFFGKGLLDQTKPRFETSSSDDEAKSTVSDDKTIKLTPEEVVIVNASKIKQQQQTQPAPPQLQQSPQQQRPPQQQILPQKWSKQSLPMHVKMLPQQVKVEGNNSNDGSQMVTIKSETPEGRKDDLNDILNNIGFKMDTSEMDEMLKGVLTEESQDSQETNTSTSSQMTVPQMNTSTPIQIKKSEEIGLSPLPMHAQPQPSPQMQLNVMTGATRDLLLKKSFLQDNKIIMSKAPIDIPSHLNAMQQQPQQQQPIPSQQPNQMPMLHRQTMIDKPGQHLSQQQTVQPPQSTQIQLNQRIVPMNHGQQTINAMDVQHIQLQQQISTANAQIPQQQQPPPPQQQQPQAQTKHVFIDQSQSQQMQGPALQMSNEISHALTLDPCVENLLIDKSPVVPMQVQVQKILPIIGQPSSNIIAEGPMAGGADDGDANGPAAAAAPPASYNQKTSERMRLDEGIYFV